MIDKLTNLIAQARSAARRGVAWALWSRRNAIITAAGVLVLFMVAFVVSTTGVAVDVQNGVRRAGAASSPSVDPLRDYTTKPRTPSELATGEAGALTPKPGTRGADTVEQTAAQFMTAWLAGARLTETDRDAWAESMHPYVTDALRDEIASAPMSAVPTADVTSTKKDSLGMMSTVKVTLSTGQFVTLQMMYAGVSPGQWMVRGLDVTPL